MTDGSRPYAAAPLPSPRTCVRASQSHDRNGMDALVGEAFLYLKRSRLARNVSWNLIGSGLPMLAMLVSVPILIHHLGTARFGLLSLVWMIAGYFSLFDFGLGRALTQIVARRAGARDDDMTRTVCSALSMMAALGVAGGLLFAITVPSLVGGYLPLPEAMRNEAVVAMLLTSLTIPLVVVTTGFRGLLEGHQRFDLVNMLRGPLGILTTMGPLALVPFTDRLPGLIIILVAVRALGCLAHLAVCVTVFPELRHPRFGAWADVRQLLSFGGWLTISNIAAPLLMYAGRLILAFLVSAEAVAYFSTPSDIVINFLMLPSILANVLYPRFAQIIANGTFEASRLYRRGLMIIAGLTAPLSAISILMSHSMLSWWIGESFAAHSALICQLLIFGVFINGFGFLGEAVIQSAGRPDLTAKLHIFEAVLFFPYTFYFILQWGIVGAAMSWIVRIVISGGGIALLAHHCLSSAQRGIQAGSNLQVSK